MDFEVGYWGLFFASFLAATVVPFSSEAILSAIIIAGYNPVYALVIATSGNWLGGLTNYGLGYMGKLQWIHKYLRIPADKLDKTKNYLIGKELWIATFCWVPFVGDIMAVALGLIRANFWLTAIGMLIGKAARYVVWAYLTIEVQSRFL